MTSSQQSNLRRRKQAGFGLIELLVTMSILILITATILVRHSSFDNALLLRSQAYEVALSIRQAQQYAVSSVASGIGPDQFGVHFDTTNANQYIVFRDVNNNNQYDGLNEDFGPRGFIDPRFFIRQLVGSNAPLDDEKINILFRRPNFDANFNPPPNSSGNNSGVVYIDIGLLGTTEADREINQVRRVEVTSTGQISVANY